MTTTTRKRPPLRLPRRAPVTVTHLRANNDANGNPRRCFVITTLDGLHVETIDEGYKGESAYTKRYPWFNWYACDRLGLGHAWAQMIDTTPAEYRRMLRREPVEGTERIRAMADRYTRRYDAWGKRHDA